MTSMPKNATYRWRAVRPAMKAMGIWLGPVLRPVDRLFERIADAGSGWVLKLAVSRARGSANRRLETGKVRTLWGVTPILTLPLKVRADHALGFESQSLVYTTYHISKDFSYRLKYLDLATRIRPWLNRAMGRLVLAIALQRYDVFHLFADRGLVLSERRFGIHRDELEALRGSGKRFYVYAYGADVRTKEATLTLGEWNFCRDCDDPGRYCICDDREGAQAMEKTAAAATALVSQGDMLAYMPGAHNIAYWPIDTERIGFVGVEPHEGPLRIAHAPNHPHFKGTRYLEASIERLNERGIAVELVRVSGVSNEKVLELFASADVIADQFIGGAYGYTALEAMARGKPVLTYVRHRDLVPAAEECPFLNSTPDGLDDVLIWCAANRGRLQKIGAQGRAYVERHHSIGAVASRLAKLYIETANFPPGVNGHLESYQEDHARSIAGVEQVEGWEHPFIVGD